VVLWRFSICGSHADGAALKNHSRNGPSARRLPQAVQSHKLLLDQNMNKTNDVNSRPFCYQWARKPKTTPPLIINGLAHLNRKSDLSHETIKEPIDTIVCLACRTQDQAPDPTTNALDPIPIRSTSDFTAHSIRKC